jgi:hypothetical protein
LDDRIEKFFDPHDHLAAGEQGLAATALTRAALSLVRDSRAGKREDAPLGFPEPQVHFRDWCYSRIVSNAVPALAKAVGLDAVRLFPDLLDDAIRLSRKLSEDRESDEDYL